MRYSFREAVLRRGIPRILYTDYTEFGIALTTVIVMDFYRGLILKLGEEPTHKKVTMFEQLQKLIYSYYHAQRITHVIIVDEAQSLSNKVLDDLRILSIFPWTAKILLFSDNALDSIFSITKVLPGW